MTSLGTLIFTHLFGKKMGEDEFGNEYYKSSKFLGKNVGRYNKERRWVIFNGKAEASKIPPYWHGWIHYNTDEIPEKEQSGRVYEWEKQHTPNLTGTDLSYQPKGHKKSENVYLFQLV
jgi:NADH:ubiquinone oxidoreductase subunit